MSALSITKLRVGAEAYQLSGVAQTLGDYYTGNGEAAGLWIGGGSGVLGLTGDVAPDDLRAVLAGIAPNKGGQSPNGGPPIPHPRRVPGFDITFKTPKSVSVLYAVTDDPTVQGAIIDAGNRAVTQTIGWLEREAIRVRRGSNNKPWVDALRAAGHDDAGIRELPTTGLVAASFRHRTSRAGDPFLHWHVLAANMTQGVDGKWSSFVHPELYRHGKAAGEIFQAVVREELTRTLGIEWRPGRHVNEIAGIPDTILRTFSKRRDEIEAWTIATGTPADPAGNQAAALATRRSKTEQESTVGLSERWRDEATEAGWGPAEAEQLLALSRSRTPADYVAGIWRLAEVAFDENGQPYPIELTVTPDEWVADVLRRDLTNHITTFTRIGVTEAVAARLGEGATVTTIERVASHLLASDQVLAVGDCHFTSREIAGIEQRFINSLNRPTGPAAALELIEGHLRSSPTLGADQAAAIRAVATGTTTVGVLIGPAGTGKTFALDTLRSIYTDSGFRVIGAAPSARAARELADGAGIASSTMHSLLGQLDRGRASLDARTVLVIDEAGMADIRTLEKLTSLATREGARVVLVGDHRQLPAIGAGGGFAHAITHARTVTELGVNRRQKHVWEQRALQELRDGNVPEAVNSYIEHKRVIVAPDGASMIDTAVNAWFAAQQRGLDLVLQAGTNDIADRLNNAVVERLSSPGGPLSGMQVVGFAGVRLGVGERVVVRRNYRDHSDRTIRVLNGDLGTIAAFSTAGVSIRFDDRDETVTLGQGFINAGGRLTHGYALTTHRTQGGTWDASIAVGLDGLYREGAYTALSRGREQNVLIITNPEMTSIQAQLDPELKRHDKGLPLPDEKTPTPVEDLLAHLEQRRGKNLAHTLDPDVARIDQLAQSVQYTDLIQRAALARHHEQFATERVGETLANFTTRFERFEHTANHIVVGSTVKAVDRNNIGTVTDLDGTNGAATVKFRSVVGKTASVTFDWSDLEVMKPAVPHELPSETSAMMAVRRADHERAVDAWETTLAAYGSGPINLADLERAATQQLDAMTMALSAARPDWLTASAGDRPPDPVGAVTWDTLVKDIARYRLEHSLPTSSPLLGSRPVGDAASGWDRLTAQVNQTQTWLAGRPAPRLEIDSPSQDQLRARLSEVGETLGAAPSPRPTIEQLLAGQQTLDGDQQRETVAGPQQDRRAWIIENWPHVIEQTEITRALGSPSGPHDDLLAAVDGQPSAPELPGIDL